jgi:hypothetical protein
MDENLKNTEKLINDLENILNLKKKYDREFMRLSYIISKYKEAYELLKLYNKK